MSPLIEPVLITRAEAAALLGVTERTIDRYAESEHLTKIHVPRPFGASATRPTSFYDKAQVTALKPSQVHDV